MSVIVPMNDELWASLTQEAMKKVNAGLLVMNDVNFRVAIIEAYKQGYQDGWKESRLT